MENYKHDIAAYAGYLKDNKELLECTSGGIATALAKSIIQQGGVVAGVSYSKDFYKAEYVIIDKLNDIDKLKGSKYIEVDKGNIFKDVKERLEEGQKVLFFGLPCMVGAMRRFLNKAYENFIAVELICHGPTSQKVHQQYVEMLEKKYNSKIVDFSVRKKNGRWTPAYLYAKFENGKVFQEEFYSTEYGYAFSIMSRPSCYNCQFRGDKREGDIMIGDFWGASPKDSFWNENGLSAILVHTEKGNELLKSVDSIALYKTTDEKIIKGNQNIIKTRAVNPSREKFAKLFAEHDLFYAVKHTKKITTRIKEFIKKIVPDSLKPFVRKIYHLIRG